MSESQTHKRLKKKLAGTRGTTEKQISRNRRLDAKNRSTNIAIEIEKSGNIKQALQRLKTQKNAKRSC